MAQVHVNPDDIDRFVLELKQFNAQLADAQTRLQAQFVRLGDTWRDQEHEKYAQEFTQAMRSLHQFRRASDVHIPFLQKKAALIRDFLAHRLRIG